MPPKRKAEDQKKNARAKLAKVRCGFLCPLALQLIFLAQNSPSDNEADSESPAPALPKVRCSCHLDMITADSFYLQRRPGRPRGSGRATAPAARSIRGNG